MNELSLFTGAGGGLLASCILGHDVVCAVERDAYCIEVLIQRQNERTLSPFPIWDDICTFDGRPWRGTVDLVSGGFPCQAFSSAARGRNVSDKDLWHEMYRVVREVRPGVVFAENVSEKAISKAQSDLLDLGYNSKRIKLSAKDVGADHIRDRWWLLAYTDMYSQLCSAQHEKVAVVQELHPSIWERQPEQLRVFDGVAFRVDRLKAAGNGQVPFVAAIAWVELHRKLFCQEQK